MGRRGRISAFRWDGSCTNGVEDNDRIAMDVGDMPGSQKSSLYLPGARIFELGGHGQNWWGHWKGKKVSLSGRGVTHAARQRVFIFGEEVHIIQSPTVNIFRSFTVRSIITNIQVFVTIRFSSHYTRGRGFFGGVPRVVGVGGEGRHNSVWMRPLKC